MTQNEKWTNELLDLKRTKGDPFADKAAQALFTFIDGKTRDEVHNYIVEFVSRDFKSKWNNQIQQTDPPELVEYFENFDDFQLTSEEINILNKGARFFSVHGPSITLGLAMRSLLKQYAHTKAIEVLRTTTLLEKHVNRRILETMQFVIDVMNGSWMDENGKLNLDHPGILSIKKLRLVHAMIRYRINNKMYDPSLGKYDEVHFGHPINQEDMAFALQTFSIETIQALLQIGENISDEEKENYFQCWKIIGRSLGVDTDLEPVNYADGVALQNKIYERHFTLPNTTGPALAKALMNWFVDTVPLTSQKTFLTFAKVYNGPNNIKILSDHLDLDMNDAHEDLIVHLETDLSMTVENKGLTAESHHKAVRENFFIHFIQSLIKTERGGKGTTFSIGDGFEAAWNINDYGAPKNKFDILIDMIVNLVNKVISWFSSRKKNQSTTA